MRTRTTNSHVLTVGHRVESPDTTLSGEPHLTQIEKSTLPVTAVRSVAKGSTSRRASAPDSSRNSRIHSHPKLHSTTAITTSATLVEPRLSLHPDCPDEGQFGVNVIARRSFQIRSPPPLPEDRRPLRATAWPRTLRCICVASRPSALRAGRCEYEQIRRRIQHADVVHIDETGIKRDGEQAWMWTFTTDEHTLYAVRESRGSDVPAEVLGEDFAGTVVCDGWTAYPAFTSNLQRCWAHILREAEDVADKYEDGEPIHRHLTQMYVGLQSWLETDPSLRERAQMHRSSQNGLKSLVRCSATDDPVATLLGKIKGGIDHWLTFIGEPAVSPTNNAAENALREPVVLRKIIGTLRNDRGMFVHDVAVPAGDIAPAGTQSLREAQAHCPRQRDDFTDSRCAIRRVLGVNTYELPIDLNLRQTRVCQEMKERV